MSIFTNVRFTPHYGKSPPSMRRRCLHLNSAASRCFVCLSEKVAQTTAAEDRRTRKEMQVRNIHVDRGHD